MTSRQHRRIVRTLVAAALATTATVAIPTSPAQAIPLPFWPAQGRAPIGCTTATATLQSGGTVNELDFTDTTTPTVSSVTLNGGTRVVLGPHGLTITFAIHVSEQCSGTNQVIAAIQDGGATPTFITFTNNGDPFDAAYGLTAHGMPSGAGSSRIPFLLATPRLGAFKLNPDLTLRSYVAVILGPDPNVVTGPWSSTTFYSLRQTTITAKQSATSVKRKHSATVTATLSYADDNAWRRDNNETVLVQVRSGKGRWITKKTLITSATGTAAYTFAPTATSQVRFVHTDQHAGRYTAASTSAPVTVKVV